MPAWSYMEITKQVVTHYLTHSSKFFLQHTADSLIKPGYLLSRIGVSVREGCLHIRQDNFKVERCQSPRI